jgi:predicted DNA-binding antitoxin AbrB/MazE fold protein
MQVEALYDNGIIRFLKPVNLKGQKVQVMIEVPDEEVVGQPAEKSVYIDEMNAILGPVREQLRANPQPPMTNESLRELFCREWEGKHRG